MNAIQAAAKTRIVERNVIRGFRNSARYR